MKTLFKVIFVALFVFFSSLSVFGQANDKIEKELVSGIKDIQKYSIYGGEYEEKKLSNAQEVFEKQLLEFTKVRSTLNYKFRELDKLMFIVTSEDGSFRNYSWDLQDGGTMHRFARVYQYQGADGKVYSRLEDTPEVGIGPGFVTDIFTLNTKTGKVYIVCSTFISSSKLISQSADLYKIEGKKLNDKVKLIKTRSGLTNRLSFEYDNFSVIDRENRPTKLISFDEETGVLKIPVVAKDTEYPDGRVTDQFISYRFDGTYFVRVS
jgi:hypothetical protein